MVCKRKSGQERCTFTALSEIVHALEEEGVSAEIGTGYGFFLEM